MSNISKNFQNKAKRGLKCGAYADGVVPSYEEQAAAMEAEQIAAAKAKFAPQPKPGLMARVFGAARPAPAPAPEPTPAPSVVDTIKNRNNTLRTIANYANGKVPTHVGPGVVDGPGGPREDRVPAMLSDDEAVLPAKTVMALGGPEAVEALIEQTNDGRPPARGLSAGKFADGFMGRAKDMVSGAVDWAKSAAPKAAPVETAPGIRVGEASMADFNAASNASQRAAINTAANGSNTAKATLDGARAAINGKNTTSVASIAKGAGRVASNAGQRVPGLVRAGLATSGIEGAVRGYNTTNDEYAQRLNIDTPDSMLGGLALRTAGVASDVGAAAIDTAALPYNMIRHGLDTNKWWSYRDNFNDVAAAKETKPIAAAATSKPVQAAVAVPTKGAPTQQPLTPSQADPENPNVTVARTLGAQGRYAGSGAIPTKGENVIRTVGGEGSNIFAGRDAKGQLVLTGGHEQPAEGGKRTLSSGDPMRDMIKQYGMATPMVLNARLQNQVHQIQLANNRMGYQWKQIENQADRHSKLLDSQFGPAWDKDGKPNEVRQKVDKQLAATMAKFGVQHPGMMTDDQMQHFLSVKKIIDEAEDTGTLEKVYGWAKGAPATENASIYDKYEKMKLNPSVLGGGRWEIDGTPIDPWSTTLAGGGLTKPLDAQVMRTLNDRKGK